MEIKINITPEEIAKLEAGGTNSSKNTDTAFLAELFCDNYCKFPDGHIEQETLDGICNACPMRLITED